jgi:hypothetical protein
VWPCGCPQGMATLKYMPSEDFMLMFMDVMESKLDQYSWLDIPNTVTALSKMLYTPREAVAKKLIKKVGSRSSSAHIPRMASEGTCRM